MTPAQQPEHCPIEHVCRFYPSYCEEKKIPCPISNCLTRARLIQGMAHAISIAETLMSTTAAQEERK
jgi:hypothetical protein